MPDLEVFAVLAYGVAAVIAYLTGYETPLRLRRNVCRVILPPEVRKK